MKKIYFISIFIISLLLVSFFVFKFIFEHKVSNFISSTYNNKISYSSINCINFLNDSCIVNNMSYILNNETINIDEVEFTNISDINSILSKSLKKGEIKNIDLTFKNIHAIQNNSFKDFLDSAQLSNINLKINITMINEEDVIYSQTKTFINLGIFNIENKLNFIDGNNMAYINNNDINISYNKTELIDLIYSFYLKDFNSNPDKKFVNSLYFSDGSSLLSKEDLFSSILKIKDSFVLNLDKNKIFNFLNKNKQFENKLLSLLKYDNESININIKNKNNLSTEQLLNAFNLLSSNIISKDLESLEISIF